MILEITNNADIVKSLMTDSEIWEKIKEDGIEKESFNPVIFSNVIMLTAVVDEVIGMHQFTDHGHKVLYHPILLKKFRKQYGREFFGLGIKWFFDNTKCSKLTAEIPVTDKSTINLAKHLNFNEIATIKNGVSKNNKFIDLKVLRLDRWAA